MSFNYGKHQNDTELSKENYMENDQNVPSLQSKQ